MEEKVKELERRVSTLEAQVQELKQSEMNADKILEIIADRMNEVCHGILVPAAHDTF